MRESLFIVGIFASGLIVGYLAGQHSTAPLVDPRPSNYDPARALCNDVLKAERDRNELCWQSAINALKREQ